VHDDADLSDVQSVATDVVSLAGEDVEFLPAEDVGMMLDYVNFEEMQERSSF